MNEKSHVSLVFISLVATLVLSGCDSVGFKPKVPKCDDPDALKLTADLIRSNSETPDALTGLPVNLIANRSLASTEMILIQGTAEGIGKSSCVASFVFTDPSVADPSIYLCNKYISRTEYELQYDTKGQLVSTIQEVGPLECVKYTQEEVTSFMENPTTPVAQNARGFRYYNGVGVSQDYAEAMKWFRKAADQGNAEAQDSLGDMYVKGEGVPKDSLAAVKWYRSAAEQGLALAQFKLGSLYYLGYDVPQNYAEAVKWIRKAADQGNSPAQNVLGEIYYYGRGVSKNIETARNWWEKTASNRDLWAIYALGESFYAGDEFGATVDADLATTYWGMVTNSAPPTDQLHKLASAGLQCIREGKSSKQCEPLRCSIEGRSDCPDL